MKNITLAFDIGSTNLRVAYIDADYAVHNKHTEDISNLTHEQVYNRVYDLTSNRLAQYTSPIANVCLSLSGHVDLYAGTVMHRDDDGEMQTFPITDQLRKITDNVPCTIVNDGTAISLAEWKIGAANGKTNTVSIHIGTYTASGVIINNAPVERRTGGLLLGASLAERPDGSVYFANEEFCGAGLERILSEFIASQPTSELARQYSPHLKAGEYIYLMAQNGNMDAHAIYKRAGKRLGVHIGSILNIFDPEVVTIGGRMMDAADYFMPTALEIVNRFAIHSIDDTTNIGKSKIVKSRFLHDGGLVGAAIAARQL